MPLYAIERVDDAVELTRSFLLPFDPGRWGRLAVLALFVGGGTSVGSSAGSSSAGTGAGRSVDVDVSSLDPEWVLLAAAALVVAVLLGVLVGLVSATFEFAFVESLRTERVAIREYVRRFWRKGVGLFAFQVGLGVAGAGLVLVLVGVVVLPAVVGVPALAVLLALVAVPALAVVALALVLALAFTRAFAVPVALADDVGVLEAWRRLWPTLRAEYRQFGAFAGVGFLLLAATGILVSAAVAVPVALVAIPFGLLFGGGLLLLDAAFPVAVLVMAVAGIGFLLCALAVVALVQVPVQSFLRFYALAVLGDVAPEWDLLGDRRPPLD